MTIIDEVIEEPTLEELSEIESEEDYDPEEGICGFTWDHTEVIVYEDSEMIQWNCSECGAEGYSDKD